MATLTEREKLKFALADKNIKDWSDADLDSFIESLLGLQMNFKGK